MASTPAPQPTSSTSRGRRRFSRRSKCRRQPRVVPWWPVPKASPASISMPMSLAPTCARSCAPWTRKRPAADRREAGERIGDPVALFGERRIRARRPPPRPPAAATSVAKVVLVRLEAEISLDQPRLAAARPRVFRLERGRGRLGGLEALDDQVCDRPRPPLVGGERQAMSGVVGRQAFEHRRRVSRPVGLRQLWRPGTHPCEAAQHSFSPRRAKSRSESGPGGGHRRPGTAEEAISRLGRAIHGTRFSRAAVSKKEALSFGVRF